MRHVKRLMGTIPRRAGGGAALLLDTYTARFAVDLTRRIRTGETSPFRYVRASDSMEFEGSFDANGDVDEAAIEANIGASTVTINAVRDQSGNEDDPTQATASLCPALGYSGGSLLKLNGKLYMVGDGVNDYLSTGNMSLAQTGDVSYSRFDVLEIVTPANDTGYGVALLPGTSSSDRRCIMGVDDSDAGLMSERFLGGNTVFSAASPSGQALIEAIYTGSGVDVDWWINGAAQTVDSSNMGNLNVQADSGIVLCRGQSSGTPTYDSPGNKTDNKVQSSIWFLSDQTANRSAIEADINAHFGTF